MKRQERDKEKSPIKKQPLRFGLNGGPGMHLAHIKPPPSQQFSTGWALMGVLSSCSVDYGKQQNLIIFNNIVPVRINAWNLLSRAFRVVLKALS